MKKLNTNINRTEISSEEINAAKDFDKLYDSYIKTTKPFFKQNWFIANSILLVTAGVVAAVLLFNNEEPETNKSVNQVVTEISTEPSEEIATTIEAPFVNPPIDGLNVPFSTYIVSNNKAQTIQHTSGSFIKIPHNAFINEHGEAIKGKVEIKYREFKDVAEIFASGIPMTYEQNGEEFHFESAGMIEILAYQDGKPVFINPKKKIDIEMTSDYASTKYNLYHLDTTNRKWLDIGKDKVIKREEKTALADEEAVVNTTSVVESFVESSNIATTPEKNPELKAIKEEIIVIQKDIEKIKKTKPEQPIEATEKRFRFNLDIDKKEFPEMAVYEGLEFEIGKENKDFSPKLTNKEWHDISLSKNELGKYILTLKRYYTNQEAKSNLDKNSESNMDIKKFIVYPVYEGQNFKDAMADFNRKFEVYSTKLNKRKEDERIKKEEYEKKIAEFKAEQERKKKERMEKTKKQRENWVKDASKSRNAIQTSSEIYRLFSIESFGVYNCDNPISLPKGQTILARFYTSKGKEIMFNKIFLVEKSKNAVFAYYPGTTKRFKFNPEAENMIIGVSNRNQLITYSSEEFKTIPQNDKKHDFIMEVKEVNPENLSELKQCISFL